MPNYFNLDLQTAVPCYVPFDAKLASQLNCTDNSISWRNELCTPGGVYGYTKELSLHNRAGCCQCTYWTPKYPAPSYLSSDSLNGFFQASGIAIGGLAVIWSLALLIIAILHTRQAKGPGVGAKHEKAAESSQLAYRAARVVPNIWRFIIWSFVAAMVAFVVYFIITAELILNKLGYANYFALPFPTFNIITHVVGGAGWLLFSAPQMLPWLRRTRPALHKTIGYIACAFGFVCIFGGYLLVIGPHQTGLGGVLTMFTFETYMLYAIVVGMVHARRQRIVDHQIWMTRAVLVSIGTAMFSRPCVVVFTYLSKVFGGPAPGPESGLLWGSLWMVFVCEMVLWLGLKQGLFATLFPHGRPSYHSLLPSLFKRCPFSGTRTPLLKNEHTPNCTTSTTTAQCTYTNAATAVPPAPFVSAAEPAKDTSVFSQQVVSAAAVAQAVAAITSPKNSLQLDQIPSSKQQRAAPLCDLDPECPISVTDRQINNIIQHQPMMTMSPLPNMGPLVITSLSPEGTPLNLKARIPVGPSTSLIYLSLPCPSMMLSIPIGHDVNIWAPAKATRAAAKKKVDTTKAVILNPATAAANLSPGSPDDVESGALGPMVTALNSAVTTRLPVSFTPADSGLLSRTTAAPPAPLPGTADSDGDDSAPHHDQNHSSRPSDDASARTTDYYSTSGQPWEAMSMMYGWTVRAYSPVVLPAAVAAADPLYTPDTLLLLVKHLPGGLMSSLLHSMQPGETIWAQAPSGRFHYKVGRHKRVGLVAAGSGLSGVMPVITAELDSPSSAANSVTLLILARSEKDVLMAVQLQAMVAAYSPRFKVVVLLSGGVSKAPVVDVAHTVDGEARTTAVQGLASWAEVRGGRVSQAVVEDVFGPGGPDAFLGVCGPPMVNEMVVKAGMNLGYPKCYQYVWGFGTSDR